MIYYNKLRGRIAEKYGSISAFHEKNKENLACTYATVTNKINGISGFTQEEILTWAKCLDINPSELYEYFFK